MIKLKIKTENKISFTIPVPYSILHIGCSFLSSGMVWRLLNKRATERTMNKRFLQTIDKKHMKHLLKQLMKELQVHKGLVVVDAKLHDGTEVHVRL